MLDIDGVISVLQRSIPLQTFCLTTAKNWHSYSPNSCYEMFRVLTMLYKHTLGILHYVNRPSKSSKISYFLEVVDCRLYENVDVADDMLIRLLKECKKLKRFGFKGGVKKVEILRDLCRIWCNSKGKFLERVVIRRDDFPLQGISASK